MTTKKPKGPTLRERLAEAEQRAKDAEQQLEQSQAQAAVMREALMLAGPILGVIAQQPHNLRAGICQSCRQQGWLFPRYAWCTNCVKAKLAGALAQDAGKHMLALLDQARQQLNIQHQEQHIVEMQLSGESRRARQLTELVETAELALDDFLTDHQDDQPNLLCHCPVCTQALNWKNQKWLFLRQQNGVVTTQVPEQPAENITEPTPAAVNS